MVRYSYIIILLFVGILEACDNNAGISGESNNQSFSAEVENEDQPLLEVVTPDSSIEGFECYFILYDKYFSYDNESTSNYEMSVQAWKDSLTKRSLDVGIPTKWSLFNHKGGGPMGAEWNSYAPLFCLIRVPEKEPLLLHLNGRDMQVKWNWISDNIVSFEISTDQWYNNLIEIQSEHYPLIYKQQDIEFNLDKPNSGIGVGEILVLTIMDEGTRDTLNHRAIHIAFGE